MPDPNRHDDSDLTNASPANPLLSVKGLARLLYRMGRTFDNLNTTQMATEEFLRTGNPRVLASRSNYDLLCDLRDAAEYTLHQPDENMSLDWFCGINGSLTRTAALEPGRLRDEHVPVAVSTYRGTYLPDTPDGTQIGSWLAQARDSEGDMLNASSLLFARLARAQPFGDGNKRCALLAANRLLVRTDSPHMLAVPVEDPDRTTFNHLLADWYQDGDNRVVSYLSGWNRAHDMD